MNTNDLQRPALRSFNEGGQKLFPIDGGTVSQCHVLPDSQKPSEQERLRTGPRARSQVALPPGGLPSQIQQSTAHVAFASFVPLRLIGRAARTVKINSVNFVNPVQKNLRLLGVPRAKFVKQTLNKPYSKPNFVPKNFNLFVYMKSSHSPMNRRIFSPQTNWFSFSYTLVKSQIPNTPIFTKRSTICLATVGAISDILSASRKKLALA